MQEQGQKPCLGPVCTATQPRPHAGLSPNPQNMEKAAAPSVTLIVGCGVSSLTLLMLIIIYVSVWRWRVRRPAGRRARVAGAPGVPGRGRSRGRGWPRAPLLLPYPASSTCPFRPPPPAVMPGWLPTSTSAPLVLTPHPPSSRPCSLRSPHDCCSGARAGAHGMQGTQAGQSWSRLCPQAPASCWARNPPAL